MLPTGRAAAAEQSNVFDARYWAKAGSSLPLYSVAGNHGRNGNFFSIWPTATNVARVQRHVHALAELSGGRRHRRRQLPQRLVRLHVGGVRFYILDADWNGHSHSTGLGTGSLAGLSQLSGRPRPALAADQRGVPVAGQRPAAGPGGPRRECAADGVLPLPAAGGPGQLHHPAGRLPAEQRRQPQRRRDQPGGVAEPQRRQPGLQRPRPPLRAQRRATRAACRTTSPEAAAGCRPPVAASACSPTDAYARGWDPGRATGSSCGSPSDSSTAKPSAAGADLPLPEGHGVRHRRDGAPD